MSNCLHCNKPLKKIGNNNLNDKQPYYLIGNDWNGRKYHKKCWKEIKEEETRNIVLNNLDLVFN
jgi:hypothetical protein